MAKGDAGTVMTDMGLKRLENKIGRIYDGAKSDIEKTIDEYWNGYYTTDAKGRQIYHKGFYDRDEDMKQMLDAGEISTSEYKEWRLNQIGRGKRYEAMRDKLADRVYRANEVANAYVNDATPGIYSLNWNYSAYTIEKLHQGADMILYDEQTVKRLIRKNPNLMPEYPKERAIDRGIDLAYSKKVITNTITRHILTGKSLKSIKEELMTTIVGMSKTSALRAARTAFTGAQNGGRLACMESAQEKGIDVQKQWFSARDGRVRDSHLEANAQIKPIKKPFDVGGSKLMYPGDPSGPGREVYNCRCTLLYVVDGKSVLDPAMQKQNGSIEDFKTWEKAQAKKQGNVNPADKILTVDDAKNILKKKVGFDMLEDSLKKIHPELLIENTKQLLKLEKRFGAVHKSVGSICSEASGGDTIAYVRSRVVNPSQQNLSLCPGYYKDKAELISLEKKAVHDGWSMPCDPKDFAVYSATHEYGHMLQNIFIKEEFEKLGWTPENSSGKIDRTKKTQKAMFKWYYKNRDKVAKQCYDEIIEIAKKNNPNFVLTGNISKYGRTNYYEFFAEVFANSQCGKPNELGRAMQEWLKKKGY